MADCGKQNSSLSSAHQGYIYQDILGAYFVAKELAHGKKTTQFQFDYKKTPNGIPDKFDDLAIYYEHETIFIQVKYSNDKNQHVLTKNDFSSSSAYDLALFDLFATWKTLHNPGCLWRICLSWDKPLPEDPIYQLLVQMPSNQSLLPGTTCFQIDCEILWPANDGVLSSWIALRRHSQSIDRGKFKEFLGSLVIEVNCPKSSFLQDYSHGIEKFLAQEIESIGIGVYPNDSLSVPRFAENLCTIVRRRRATNCSDPISCDEIAHELGIKQSQGEIEQRFIIDERIFVKTQNRTDQVLTALNRHRVVVLTAEPGAGKSWLIENLYYQLQDTTKIVKHYCYIALDDPLVLKRISVNVMYANLITQILQNEDGIGQYLTKRYASNLEELNRLLGQIKKKTLLIVDGIDHISRVYQRNRGGLTEDATDILQAISQLDYSNPNISILVISQPITRLSEVLPSYYLCELQPLPEMFVEELLGKHSIPNIIVEERSLAQIIHKKSNGNALYCKYLIDYVSANKTNTSFDWITTLPAYDFNLTLYYQYLFDQILTGASVPNALCGADFSITEEELQEITHMGCMVTKYISLLKPVLRYTPAAGYSIYHESFKRFIIDGIKEQGASVDKLIYYPLIDWLEAHSFYESTKAYGHLLKLYFEVEKYDCIANTISIDFIENSLFYAQPFCNILKNHNLQKASLPYISDFKPMIIISEQTKIIDEVANNLTDQLFVEYLNSIQMIHGDEMMSRVFWNEGHLLVEVKDALRLFVNQTYRGDKVVHWSLVPIPTEIPFELLGSYAIRLLHTQEYQKFDRFIYSIYANPDYIDAFYQVLDELEWWSIYVGHDWVNNTKSFQEILAGIRPSSLLLNQAVMKLLSFRTSVGDNWREMIHDVMLLVRATSKADIDGEISILSQSSWFHNWIIYLIKITELSSREHQDSEIVEAFAYLIRDLDSYKGYPRVIDLYDLFPSMRKSFHWGLLLCKGNTALLKRCCDLLGKVTELTTSIQRSYSGPLKDEEYLEFLFHYLPGDYVIEKYEEQYKLIVSKQVYADVAEIAFKYAYILGYLGKDSKAKEKYREGIRALSAYGYRKDRTFSEVLDCSVPFQKKFGTLNVEYFFKLYDMSMSVVYHTDGRSTKSYPIEWFTEFSKVYPENALRFLISNTFESDKANWYQEDEFSFILENFASLFSPTHWFLLCKSLPLASSEKIIKYGLSVIDQIESGLKDVFSRWLQSRPFCDIPGKRSVYSQEVIEQFGDKFLISLSMERSLENKDELHNDFHSPPPKPFTAVSEEGALAFFEDNRLHESHLPGIKELITSIADSSTRKTILRQIAKSFRFERNDDIGEWIELLFLPESQEWLYFNTCLFVYVPDGWFCGLHYKIYFKRAFERNPIEAINMLKEVLGYFIAEGGYTRSIASNLINVLLELNIAREIVQELFKTIFEIVDQQLPYPPNSDFNQSLYDELEGFGRDEIVIALLIARLKTLTTEKTQGIIWSITYIAQTAPASLMKPYYWAFSHQEFLLPIHRVLLLQILKDYVDQGLINELFISEVLKTYPTGFFLEDQYIRSLVGYRLTLVANSGKSIHLVPDQLDVIVPPMIHPKYWTIMRFLGPLEGFYNSYAFRRDKIIKEYNSYSLKLEKVVTPIVPLANAVYEIINKQFSSDLLDLLKYCDPSYCCGLELWLSEIVVQVGSLSRRPESFPTPTEFLKCKQPSIANAYKYQGWVLLSMREQQLIQKVSEEVQQNESLLVLSYFKNAEDEEELYAREKFTIEQYKEDYDYTSISDNPINKLIIDDTLEHSEIIFVNPIILKNLELSMDAWLHEGLQARNRQGEIIIKMISWKEQYIGSISHGTEVPLLKGVALLIREDYYKKLLMLYGETNLKFVLINKS